MELEENGRTFGDIIRSGAKLVEEGGERYSCLAVLGGGVRDKAGYPKAELFYAKLIAPRNRSLEGDWLLPEDFENDSLFCEEQVTNHRVVAMCFAAAIADAGGLQ
jgi:hypothetical protein